MPCALRQRMSRNVLFQCLKLVVALFLASICQSLETATVGVSSDGEVVGSGPSIGSTNKFKVVIEGWRNIPHSYAVVATHLAYELVSLLPTNAQLYFTDVRLWNENWPASLQEIFPRNIQDTVNTLPMRNQQEWRNLTIRVAFPYNTSPRSDNSKVVVVATSEFLTVNKDVYFSDGVETALDAVRDTEASVIILTHSKWSQTGFINTGFPPRKVSIVPLGVSSDFRPLTVLEKREARSHFLGNPNTTVFFSNGAMTSNKGIDLLLKIFKLLLDNYPDCCLLVLKGLDKMYSSKWRLSDWVYQYKLPVGSVRYDGQMLSTKQLNLLYNSVDVYVSPYKAEAFNLPVLEAMACGLPVIVTSGGSTDDFVPEHSMGTMLVKSKLVKAPKNISLHDSDGRWLEPDEDHLLKVMEHFLQNRKSVQAAASKNNVKAAASFTWKQFARGAIDLF